MPAVLTHRSAPKLCRRCQSSSHSASSPLAPTHLSRDSRCGSTANSSCSPTLWRYRPHERRHEGVPIRPPRPPEPGPAQSLLTNVPSLSCELSFVHSSSAASSELRTPIWRSHATCAATTSTRRLGGSDPRSSRRRTRPPPAPPARSTIASSPIRRRTVPRLAARYQRVGVHPSRQR